LFIHLVKTGKSASI